MRFQFWAVATLVAIVGSLPVRASADAIDLRTPGGRVNASCPSPCATDAGTKPADAGGSVAHDEHNIVLASTSESASLLILGSGLAFIAFRLRRGRRNQ